MTFLSIYREAENFQKSKYASTKVLNRYPSIKNDFVHFFIFKKKSKTNEKRKIIVLKRLFSIEVGKFILER
jgi:hypothetical protein